MTINAGSFLVFQASANTGAVLTIRGFISTTNTVGAAAGTLTVTTIA